MMGPLDWRSRLGLAGLAALVSAGGPPPLAAQSSSTAGLRGEVVAEGEPLVGAEVTLKQPETGLRRAVLSASGGAFFFPFLPPGGPYILSVSSLGYGMVVRENLVLRVGETLRVEVELRPDALQVEGLQVRVERDAVFRPDRIGPVTLLDSEALGQLPLLTRDLTQLATLSPLVKTSEEGFSIAGQNDRYNTLLVDGAPVQDLFGITPGGIPGGQAGARLIPVDAVAQYEIRTAPFDVRLSGFTGGVLNAVTRSGTNEWTASGFFHGRSGGLTGDLVLVDGSRAEAAEVERSIGGFTVGGPLVRDRLHLFLAAEFERRTQPPDGAIVGRDPVPVTRISPDAVAGLAGVLGEQYGHDAGRAGVYGLERGIDNVFARVDGALRGGHRFTLRHVYGAADDDGSPERGLTGPYGLQSNGSLLRSRSHTTSFQLFSTLAGPWRNELDLTFRRSTDEVEALVDWPQIGVDLVSTSDGTSYQREVRTGASFYAQDNRRSQTSFTLTDDVTGELGAHSVTLGLALGRNSVSERFLPGSAGTFHYLSLSDLVDNVPYTYERTFLREGADPEISFPVWELGVYAQDEFRATDALTFRFGLRVDVPSLPDRPGLDEDVLRVFGKSTATIPSGKPMISPRVGFNWQSSGERRLQVRGGAGIFTGRIPYVWLASAYALDGLRLGTLACRGRISEQFPPVNSSPPYVPGQPATECLFPSETPPIVRSVTLFDESYRLPQDIKLSIAVDREVADGWTASLGAIFTRALSQLFLEDLNIGTAVDQDEDIHYTLGYGGRPNFGTPTPDGYRPIRRDGAYAQVLHATNRADDNAWVLSAEVRGRLSDRAQLTTGYAWGRSWDRMSLVFPDLISNFGSNPVEGHPNRPGLHASRFDRRHKLVGSLQSRPAWEGLEVALIYTGESGLPYSYVYRGDLNGDGYPGPGPAFDRLNDLIYVPEQAIEVPLKGIASISLFNSAIHRDECLAAHRGRTLPRNACRAPWTHRLDLRLAQEVSVGGFSMRIEGDLVNALNLLNAESGRVRTTPPSVDLLETDGRVDSRGHPPDLQVVWSGGVLPRRTADGRLIPAASFVPQSPESQWQAQLGAKIRWR